MLMADIVMKVAAPVAQVTLPMVMSLVMPAISTAIVSTLALFACLRLANRVWIAIVNMLWSIGSAIATIIEDEFNKTAPGQLLKAILLKAFSPLTALVKTELALIKAKKESEENAGTQAKIPDSTKDQEDSRAAKIESIMAENNDYGAIVI
jgi:hypothetical protein